jgi:cyclophilin family peptidyl-prolyl cis-trans isomerase
MGIPTKRFSAHPLPSLVAFRCRAADRARLRRTVFGWGLAALACLCFHGAELRANPFVRLDYNLSFGNRFRETVFLELFDDRPLTRDNFLAYVNAGRFDNSIMHRLAYEGNLPFVLQGGGFHPVFQTEPAPLNISLDPDAQVDLDGNPNTDNPTVNNEFTNSPFRSNVRGTLAMAKLGGNPNSATSEYFFNLKDNGGTAPNGLDFQNGGFTVFARVVGDGMNLIDAYAGTSPSTGLPRLNLNEDENNNGVRDSGPFSNVPVLPNQTSFLVLTLDRAERIDYLGNGLTTNVPAAGLTFSTRDAYIDTGTVFTGSGSLRVGAGRTLGIREGYSLNRSLINFGTLQPGLLLGTITLQSFRQDPGASLEIELSGTTVDKPNDQLVVTAGALLGGDLDVTLLGGFTPVAGNTFTILTAGSISDTFDNINLPLLTQGLLWDVNQTATAFTLSVVTDAADFNQDGVVNAADYVKWRRSNGSQANFNLWRANFGNTRGGSIGAGSGSQTAHFVPEPTSAIMLVACGLVLVTGRRFVDRRTV